MRPGRGPCVTLPVGNLAYAVQGSSSSSIISGEMQSALTVRTSHSTGSHKRINGKPHVKSPKRKVHFASHGQSRNSNMAGLPFIIPRTSAPSAPRCGRVISPRRGALCAERLPRRGWILPRAAAGGLCGSEIAPPLGPSTGRVVEAGRSGKFPEKEKCRSGPQGPGNQSGPAAGSLPCHQGVV